MLHPFLAYGPKSNGLPLSKILFIAIRLRKVEANNLVVLVDFDSTVTVPEASGVEC